MLWLYAALFLVVIGAVISLPSIIIVVAGMVPTIISWLFASSGDRHSTTTLAAMNLAGVAPVVGMLWERGHNINNALQILSEPVPWLIMLGASAAALALNAILPNIGVAMMQRAAVIRVQKIHEARRSLVAEWGNEVKKVAEDRKRANAPQTARRPTGASPPPAGPANPGQAARSKKAPSEVSTA
ncbi:MAG TPA: hypothetical protein QF665_05070 [Alphaproteobacteria bacterium]|nr:hypothetical protein [Alphaproteobacteria bacterium]